MNIKEPSAHRRISVWIREQFTLDGYQNGDPVDHKEIVAHVIMRKRREMQGAEIVRFCWNHTLSAIARAVFKRGKALQEWDENDEENETTEEHQDEHPTFEFYQRMGVHPPLIQLVLAFKGKRVYDPKADSMVCLYTLSQQDVKRVHSLYGKKTVELANKTEILGKIDEAMTKFGLSHVSKDHHP